MDFARSQEYESYYDSKFEAQDEYDNKVVAIISEYDCPSNVAEFMVDNDCPIEVAEEYLNDI